MTRIIASRELQPVDVKITGSEKMSDSRVDLIVLSKNGRPLPRQVQRSVGAQLKVRLHVYQVVGRAEASDVNRWQTIARTRNIGKRLGCAPWVMFLDDDVVLGPDTVARLLEGLKTHPGYGAFAADYLGESCGGALTPHVAMGATLFRRTALGRIRFRWEDGRCECQCCCDDLREQGIAIRYLPGAVARHLKKHLAAQFPSGRTGGMCRESAAGSNEAGRVLAAFDRRHYGKFRKQFLGSLRASGNSEKVTAVGYGLYPREQAVLRALEGVEFLSRPQQRTMVPVRRLRDFQDVVERWPPETPVAYWDAADVIFQARLDNLWKRVREHPHRLLAVREPRGYPGNPAVAAWSLSIHDREARTRAFELLSSRPFLNSGFAAGTAGAFLAYLREAHRLRHSSALDGTTDWGDQMALNLYCHGNPNSWREIEEGWNYCMLGRRPGEVRIAPSGHVVSTRRVAIHVVHGHAHSLRQFELSFC